MKATSSEKGRHVVLRASAGEALPEALVRMLEDEAVACGWLRASGVLEEVELRTFRGGGGAGAGLGRPRKLEGLVHVVALEGSIGLAGGALSVGLRAIVARETDRGLETLAGEIVSARVVALEVLVTALDDVAIARALDPVAGVWLLGEPGGGAERAPAPAPRRPIATAPAASQSVSAGPVVMPTRIARPERIQDDAAPPEVGAIVDHFAFGRCEVVKSDGDRLHVKQKDARVKEIALEMLRVTPLPDEDGKKVFKLERRL